MKRAIAMSAVAISWACLLGLQAHAQTSESKTKVKAEHGQTMTFTGCLQTGTETKTYILDKVVPVQSTETTGTTGAVTTTTTYALVPSEKVELQEHVGHKVEVTGVLIPAGKGETKIKTKSKTEGAEEQGKAEIQRGPTPQLRVVSIKHLADSCSQ